MIYQVHLEIGDHCETKAFIEAESEHAAMLTGLRLFGKHPRSRPLSAQEMGPNASCLPEGWGPDDVFTAQDAIQQA